MFAGPQDDPREGGSGHMAEVERRWFRQRLAGQDAPPHFYSDADPDGDFDGALPDAGLVTQAWAVWRAEVAFANRLVGRDTSLLCRRLQEAAFLIVDAEQGADARP